MEITMWDTIVSLFRGYMGTGLLMIWFLAALVYLFFREKDKNKRILFVYAPALTLLLFWNPLFAKFVYTYVGDEIYYRILWLLPVTIVTAYLAARLCGALAGGRRLLLAGACAALVMLSGSCIYKNPFFHRAENLYHMPQAVVEICDAIEVEGREVMAAFPGEMLQFVRQYSPVVCMPYGREALVPQWRLGNPLFDIMCTDPIDVEALAALAKQNLCHYVVILQGRPMTGSMEDYDYVLFGTYCGYDVYLDTTIYRGL